MLLIISIVSITSCEKDEVSSTPKVSKSFINISFNPTNAFFSTDGSMTTPVDSTIAKTVTSKIDITFIFDDGYYEPGFFDPKARAQVWDWDDFYLPWLSTGVETRYYSTTLTKADFDAAQADQSKIATFFKDTAIVKIAPHDIFPLGSCIGGKVSASSLEKDMVFGFKNTASGKKGLLYIRTDQGYGWPMPLFSYSTKVDIIREN